RSILYSTICPNSSLMRLFARSFLTRRMSKFSRCVKKSQPPDFSLCGRIYWIANSMDSQFPFLNLSLRISSICFHQKRENKYLHRAVANHRPITGKKSPRMKYEIWCEFEHEKYIVRMPRIYSGRPWESTKFVQGENGLWK
ncbi:hypothetical protein PFISCL1PPCAC_21195, partial [Pristionchus fissidentatus]